MKKTNLTEMQLFFICAAAGIGFVLILSIVGYVIKMVILAI